MDSNLRWPSTTPEDALTAAGNIIVILTPSIPNQRFTFPNILFLFFFFEKSKSLFPE